MGGKKKIAAKNLIVYICLLIAALICVFPFIWVFLASTHTSTQVFQTEWTFRIGSNLVENYKSCMEVTNIWINLFNTIFIALVYTGLVCIIDSMAGYAFAKFHFKGKSIIFSICLCSMFIPQQVTIVPLFMEITNMNLINTLWGVILPPLANIFGVFLMRQSLLEFPEELLESGRIDGASELKIFCRIVLPTMKASFASLGILSFVQRWGDYMWPLIVLQTKEHQTVPVILSLMVTPGNPVDYGAVILGAVIVMLPVLVMFFIFQKNFIQGMLSGAIKG